MHMGFMFRIRNAWIPFSVNGFFKIRQNIGIEKRLLLKDYFCSELMKSTLITSQTAKHTSHSPGARFLCAN